MNHITIIEDDDDLGKLLQHLLRIHKFDVQLYLNGEEFFRTGSRNSDLYIIDIDLGRTSGLDICQHIKDSSAFKNKWVIMISAHPQIAELSKKVNADYLPKPFSKSHLLNKISTILG